MLFRSTLEARDPFPQALEHQGSILERPVGFHQAQGYLDSIHQDQGLLDSLPQVLEPQDSSLGSTPLEETLDSSQECHTLPESQGHSPPAQVLPQGRAGLSLVVGCMDQGAQESSPLQLAQGAFNLSQVEPFPRSLLARGVPQVGQASPPSPVTLDRLGRGLWGRMEDLLLREACW